MSNNKQSMKLYTEEQIFKYLLEHGTIDLDSFILDIKPIELPSDEEIDEMSKSYIDHINTMVHKDLERDGYLVVGFLKGAKNIINKIKGDNKWKTTNNKHQLWWSNTPG